MHRGREKARAKRIQTKIKRDFPLKGTSCGFYTKTNFVFDLWVNCLIYLYDVKCFPFSNYLRTRDFAYFSDSLYKDCIQNG